MVSQRTLYIMNSVWLMRLTVSEDSYSGNASNSMHIHNGQKFSTKDKDNDDNPTKCNHAEHYSGAWWYGDGMQSNLNGLYYPSPENPAHNGIIWHCSFGNDSLQETTMMIKPVEE